MRIAVTGATGFIGRELVRALSSEGNEIIAISRQPHADFTQDSHIKFMSADIHNQESLELALAGVDLVYHLVAIIAETRELTFEKTIAGGTGNLVGACKSRGIKKIIYISALGTSAEAPTGYFKSKWAAEESIRNSGLDYVIFRPSIVFGPEDKFINMVAKLVRYSPLIPIAGNGRMLIQPIYVRDLVKILTESGRNPNYWNKTIESGGPEQLEYREMVAIVKKVLNYRRFSINIPTWLMKTTAQILEAILRPSPLTVDQIKMLEMGNITDNRELLTVTSIKLTKLEDGLRDYLR